MTREDRTYLSQCRDKLESQRILTYDQGKQLLAKLERLMNENAALRASNDLAEGEG